MVKTNPKQRRILQFVGLAAIAGLLLVTGGFIGNAMANETGTSDQPASDDGNGIPPPSSEDSSGDDSFTGIQSGSPGAPIVGTDGNGAGPVERGIATSPVFYNRCQGDLNGVLSGSTIDPALAGFEANFLSARFVLQSLNLRADADCEDHTQQFLSMDTSWKTADEMFQVWITQRESDEPGANILRETWAEFWHNGYYYSVSAGQSYDIKTLTAGSDGDTDDAIEPLLAENSAEASALLQDVVQEITGDATFQCFYQQVEGGWDSLADLGIGDPRGAVPSGFTETNIYAQVFEAPSPDCNVPSDVQLPTSFNASWSDGRDGWLSFNVYQINEQFAEELAFGRSNEWSISWTDGTFQYELYGNRDDSGIGLDVLEAMALAVDPAFHQSCRLIESEFTQSELAEVGIGWPEAPDSYGLTESRTSGTEQSSGCDSDANAGFFNASWTFERESGAMLHASAWFDNTHGEIVLQTGYIGVSHIGWQSVNGVSYSVESWNKGDEGGDRDAMIALAKSLDPNIDIDSFNESGGPEKPPIALPADEDSAGSADGSSSASE